jgi:hypothetical protein
MHLARTQVEIDAVERDHAGEMLRYPFEPEPNRSFRTVGNSALGCD